MAEQVNKQIEADKWHWGDTGNATTPWHYYVWFKCLCGRKNRTSAKTDTNVKSLALRCKRCGLLSEVIPIPPEHQV
jgi:predicted SprT family Zn-dependent metalloprotease